MEITVKPREELWFCSGMAGGVGWGGGGRGGGEGPSDQPLVVYRLLSE